MSLTFVFFTKTLCPVLLQIVIRIDACKQTSVRILSDLSERLGCVVDAIYAVANDGALKITFTHKISFLLLQVRLDTADVQLLGIMQYVHFITFGQDDVQKGFSAFECKFSSRDT